MEYYSHSSDLSKGIPCQTYYSHVSGVMRRAVKYAQECSRFLPENVKKAFVNAVEKAAEFHDLSKLHPDNQAILGSDGNAGQLPVHHQDGGAKYMLQEKSFTNFIAASIVYSHHTGLPDFIYEGVKSKSKLFLRDDRDREKNDAEFDNMLKIHFSIFTQEPEKEEVLTNTDKNTLFNPLVLRMALSCLVRADHEDTAEHYRQLITYEEPETRWSERMSHLDQCVSAKSKTAPQGLRKEIRDSLYQECSDSPLVSASYCGATVGSGKTFSCMKYALRLAEAKNKKRIISVVPLTNIISQSVDVYRNSLVLPGENPFHIVGEHHHNVDFESPEYRYMSQMWDTPIIVTTSVQFFETLLHYKTGSLKKLQQLADSVIIIDEIHASFQLYQWDVIMKVLADLQQLFNIDFVFSSGTLPLLWQDKNICKRSHNDNIKSIVSKELTAKMNDCEKKRIQYRLANNGNKVTLVQVAEMMTKVSGPVLFVADTRINACHVAQYLKTMGKEVYHLSTVVCPEDREKIIKRVKERLEDKNDTDWYLCATSCIEAGVDLSFRTGFMERRSYISTCQIGGRVNRNNEYSICTLYIIYIEDQDASQNYQLQVQKSIARRIENKNLLNGDVQSNVQFSFEEAFYTEDVKIEDNTVTHAVASEIYAKAALERSFSCNFPFVSKMSKVINNAARTVIVNQDVIRKLKNLEFVKTNEISRGSITLFESQIKDLTDYIEAIGEEKDVLIWKGKYDPECLGIFAQPGSMLKKDRS